MIPFYIDYISDENRSKLSVFDCGHEGMNNFLVCQAEKYSNSYDGLTRLLIHKKTKNVIGYYTLKNTSLIFKPDNKLRGIPAIEIFRLAIDKDFQDQGIGTKVLQKIFFDAYEYTNTFSSAKMIVLYALNNEQCLKFYKKLKFIEMEEFFEMLYDECIHNAVPLMVNLKEAF